MQSQLSFLLPDSDTDVDGVASCSPDEAFGLAAEIVAGKWTMPIVRELLGGTRRYSQLQSALTGVSPKILTARLRLLEAEKLITRKVYATVPPKTEYKLTKLGRELEQVASAMADFGAHLASARKAS